MSRSDIVYEPPSRSGIVYEPPDGVESETKICDNFRKFLKSVKTHSEKKQYMIIY
jgi:hypothetical protein